MSKLPTTAGFYPEFPVSKMRPEGTQVRVKPVDAEIVEEYQVALDEGAIFTPIDLFYDPKEKVYRIADGHQRHWAATHCKNKRTTFPVNLHVGGLEDAIFFALGANKRNGHRLSTEDKQKSIRWMLLSPRWGSMSDNAIADHVGVDHKTVTAARAKAESVGEIPKLETRIGVDGKTYRASKPKPEKAPQPRVTSEPVEEYDEPTHHVEDDGPIEYEPEPEPPAEEPPTPIAAGPVDANGDPIPASLVESWALVEDQMRALDRQLRGVETSLVEMRAAFERHGAWSGSFVKGLHSIAVKLAGVEEARSMVAAMMPVVVCRACKGAGGSCKSCHGNGWETATIRYHRDQGEKTTAELGLAP